MKTLISIQFNDNKYFISLKKATSAWDLDYYNCKAGGFKIEYKLPKWKTLGPEYKDFADLYFRKVFKKRKKYNIPPVALEVPSMYRREDICEEATENMEKIHKMNQEVYSRIREIAKNIPETEFRKLGS